MIAPADSVTPLPPLLLRRFFHTFQSSSLCIMAPSKPKQSTKPKPVNKDRVSDDARVAKRPQRGFHRFKDGSLNVAPKSKEEKDMSVAKALISEEVVLWIVG
jgi:hypothetical protein